jgi:hypothetical protein
VTNTQLVLGGWHPSVWRTLCLIQRSRVEALILSSSYPQRNNRHFVRMLVFERMNFLCVRLSTVLSFSQPTILSPPGICLTCAHVCCSEVACLSFKKFEFRVNRAKFNELSGSTFWYGRCVATFLGWTTFWEWSGQHSGSGALRTAMTHPHPSTCSLCVVVVRLLLQPWLGTCRHVNP